jgi:hypothetical protein
MPCARALVNQGVAISTHRSGYASLGRVCTLRKVRTIRGCLEGLSTNDMKKEDSTNDMKKEDGPSRSWPTECVLLLQDLLQSCARGGRRRVEDMCYERRRAEACVDESAQHALGPVRNPVL